MQYALLYKQKKGCIFMYKKAGITLAIISAMVIGFSLNNIAISDPTDFRVAVVDIKELVSKSQEIKKLKTDQENKINQMQQTVEKARTEIAKETDPAKIAALEEKYRKEVNAQKLTLDSEYNSKLTKIDNNIKTIVIEKARSMNYNLVLPKNFVLYGGDDITAEVAKSIKQK